MEALVRSQIQKPVSRWTELIIENSTDGIIAVDSSYIIKVFNKAAEKLFGYLQQEVIGRNLRTVVPAFFIETSVNNPTKSPISFINPWNRLEKKEIFTKRKDGSEALLEAHLSKLYCDDQLIFIATLRNITEKKLKINKTEELPIEIEKKLEQNSPEILNLLLALQKETLHRKQLEATLANFFAVAQQTTESIIILDKKGVISYVNPSFEKITGFESKEVCQSRVKILFAESSLKDYKKIARTLISGNKWQGVYWAKKKDGTIYEEEATIVPVKSSQGEKVSYIAICRDITEKKRLESIIDSVDMMKNVGYIFAGIRHELGNPINSIKTSLSVLKKGLDSYSQESVLVYVERALSEITRVEYLLKALKSFSMYENLKLERVNLVSFMERFYSLAKEDSEKKGIKLNLHYTNKEIFALIDQRAFHQVLLNIFSNAVDALDGRLNPTINIFLNNDDRFIKTEIVDNGEGIPDSQKEKLFKPFHTFKPQGTGLGLVITKKLITNMQGTIEIDSVYKFGTRVAILLEKPF